MKKYLSALLLAGVAILVVEQSSAATDIGPPGREPALPERDRSSGGAEKHGFHRTHPCCSAAGGEDRRRSHFLAIIQL